MRQISLNGICLGTKGANRIIEAIRTNKNIKNWDLGNLTDSSLKYLTGFLSEEH